MRGIYKDVITAVLDGKSRDEVYSIIYDGIFALYTRQVPDTKLIMNMGVKDVREYANKRVQKQPFSDSNPFIDAGGDPFVRGADGNPVDPLDPRLVYRKRVQSLLLLKMLRRGEIIPPNTRLEMVVLDDPTKDHIGERAEEYSNYKENKAITKARLDYRYYIEHQLENPVTEILVLKYPTTSYLPPQKRYEAELAKQPSAARTAIAQTKRYPYKAGDGLKTGGKPSKARKGPPPQTYMHRGLEAQVTYAIREAKALKVTPDFLRACLAFKSQLVIKRLYKRYHLRAAAQRVFMGARNLVIKEIVAAHTAYAAVVAEVKARPKR
jgi:hypothetical protein